MSLASGGGGALDAEVLLIEPTGDDVWVVGRIDGQRIMGRALPDAVPAPGSTARFDLARERLHLFDRASGRRLA